MYVCTAIDANNACLNWVMQMYLLPPLSADEGLQYSGLIIGLWITALGIGEILSLLKKGN